MMDKLSEGKSCSERASEEAPEQETSGFLNLPEQVFASLLESDELGLGSEDSVFEAAVHWARHSTAAEDHQEFLRVMGELVLPRIRVAQLSRRTVASLVAMINTHLSELGFKSPFSTCCEGHPFEAEDAEIKCGCLFHSEPATTCADLLGVSYVVTCLSLLAMANVVQSPNFLASALAGYRQMGPRETRSREA